MDRPSMIDTLKACTGLFDTDECTQILENHNWDLEAAANFVLNIMQPSINVADSNTDPISTNHPPRSITLDVAYNNLRNKLVVNSSESIGRVKELIENAMSVNGNDHEVEELQAYPDSISIGHVFTEDFVSLTLKSRNFQSRTNDFLEIKFVVHTLRSRARNNRGNTQIRSFTIRLAPSTTLKQARDVLRNYCDVTPNNQQWTLDVDVSETAEIQSFLNNGDVVNVHERQSNDSLNRPSVRSSIHRVDSDSEEYISLSDESVDNEESNENNLNSLLPSDCTDEARGIELFVQKFANKYGPSIPAMYIGALENAINESLLLPISERRLLAIYIHNTRSICVNVFCKQIMMNECLTAFLLHHYIMWPWDFSQEGNRRWFLSKSLIQFGPQITMSIEDMETDRFPVILVLAKGRSAIESVGMIHGSENFETVMTKMTSFAEQFEKTREEGLAYEIERESRNLIKQEQDRAYQNSLDKDKEKALRLKQEELLKNLKVEENNAREKAKLVRQQEMESMLPNEPDLNENNVCIVRMRLPSGECVRRNFYSNDPLKLIFTFLGSKGYFIDECKLLIAYPRKDIAGNDPDTTLADVGIHTRELLTVEFR
ncbi:hypothetical protein GJ496_009894 [Pomphorhynchus laevis]|nr:hypothetical protein GJ496_009894 [Pomphorhynchus laevis]